MPTPVAHSICGYLIYSGVKKKGCKFNWRQLLLFVVLANLADIDYLPGILINKPNIFHHGFTHSLVCSVLVGIVLSYFFKRREEYSFVTYFALFFGVYFSHVLMDFVTVDTAVPIGEQILWPFSQDYYLSPITIFRDISKGSSNSTFFASIFDGYNVVTVASELMIFAVFTLIINVGKICKFFKKNKMNI